MINPLNQPSVMSHAFSKVPQAEIQRSRFSRNHGWKGSFDSGLLVPIYVDEYLPGDTFELSMSTVARLATPIYPILDNMSVDYFFFAIPNRLVWSNWVKLMGQMDDPGDSIDYTVPQVTTKAGGHDEGTLADYFGLPIGVDDIDPNALHFRAYNLVWNTWFRSEQLQDSVTVNKDDGPDAETDYELLRRGKRHDYFTSCTPWPCLNNEEVSLPLGSTAPCVGNTKAIGLTDGINVMGLYYDDASNELDTDTAYYGVAEGSIQTPATKPTGNKALGLVTNTLTNSGIQADLSQATAATINEFREALTLQRMLEIDARSGTRYPEVIMAHYGVMDPQHNVLQRPEYIGGGSSPIQFAPVPQTSESGTTKQGSLAATAFQQAGGIGFTKSFTEHGVLLGLACVKADLNYQRICDKMWTRQTRYDFYFPSMAHLGEQAVLMKEIYPVGTAADDAVFGYQERWAEMRHKNSVITGALRSDAAAPLDAWHLAQDFATAPSLNSDFIEEDPPVSRIIAVPSEPEIIMDAYFNLTCTRPMPVFSVPGLGTRL